MAESLAKRMILSLSVLVPMVGLSADAIAQSQGGAPQFKPAPPAATAPPAKKAVAPAPTVAPPPPPVPPAPPTPAAKATPAGPPAPPPPPPSPPAAPAATQSLPAPSVAYPPPPATTTPEVPAPPPPPGSVPPPGAVPAPPGAPPGAPPLCCPCYPGAPPGYPGATYSPYGPVAYPPTMIAPYSVPDPGFHKHDGFYLRVGLGIGAAGLNRQSSTTKTELSGGVSSFSVALGGALTENLVLYGELFSQTTTSNPKLVVDNDDRGGQSSGEFSLFGIGPGAAYYFTSTNIHLSATLALSFLSFRNLFNDERPTQDSGAGATVKLGVGKDWWVSSNWSLGAAAQLVVGSVKDLDDKDVLPGAENPSWDIVSFGLLLSGTYN